MNKAIVIKKALETAQEIIKKIYIEGHLDLDFDYNDETARLSLEKELEELNNQIDDYDEFERVRDEYFDLFSQIFSHALLTSEEIEVESVSVNSYYVFIPKLRDEIVDNLIGVTQVAEELDWTKGKVSEYRSRGTLPEPFIILQNRPMWLKSQIEAYRDKELGC